METTWSPGRILFFFFVLFCSGMWTLEPRTINTRTSTSPIFSFLFFFSIFTGVTSDVRFFSSVHRAVVELISGSLHSISNTVSTATRHGSVCNFLSRQASYFAYQQYNSSSSAATISKRSCCNAKQLTVRMTPPH